MLRPGAQVELVSIQKMTTVITDTQQGKIQDIMNLTNAKLFDMHRQLELSIANVDLLKSLLRCTGKGWARVLDTHTHTISPLPFSIPPFFSLPPSLPLRRSLPFPLPCVRGYHN